MTFLILEMLGYLIAAALIGLATGYVLWGWGQARRIARAAEAGAAAARASLRREAEAVEAEPVEVADDIDDAVEVIEDFEPVPATTPLRRLVDRPEGLLAMAPEHPDDLTEIRGIGPKTANALNATGVHLYRQLACFSEEDITWIERSISALPGRAIRGRWAEKARELHTEKYGCPPEDGDGLRTDDKLKLDRVAAS